MFLAAGAVAGIVVATVPALAHGPVRRQPKQADPGTPMPPDAPLPPGALPAPGEKPTLGVPTTGVLPLRSLAAESLMVLAGTVATTDSLDEDRLRVYHLQADQALKGEPVDGAAIVEMRGATTRPGLLANGTRAVVLLRAAPPLSYLSQHLPEGRTYYALTGGRDGIVPIANDGEARLAAEILAEGVRIQALDDQTDQRAARRALAFRELGTAHGRLVADAVVELRGLDDLTAPTSDEVAVLDRALAATTIPAPTRASLAQLAGKRAWKSAGPALRAAAIDSPLVLDAVLAARSALGDPASKQELEAYLASKDPAVRAAAIRALAMLPQPAVAELGRYATGDGDVAVRVAAIEALGATRDAGAVPTLSQTFGDKTRDVRQASGRALLAVGGPAASNAFVNLALHGGDSETRSYAAILLVVTAGRDSPDVQRLLAGNPSPEVRDVIEHGLQFKHMHQHE